jgi:hypothetical protein
MWDQRAESVLFSMSKPKKIERKVAETGTLYRINYTNVEGKKYYRFVVCPLGIDPAVNAILEYTSHALNSVEVVDKALILTKVLV